MSRRVRTSGSLVALLMVMATVGCASAPPDLGRAGAPIETGAARIVGSWWWQLRTGCTEYYTFYEDGMQVVVSGREVTLGEYRIDPLPGVAGRHALVVEKTWDHGGVDCGGSTEDSRGTVQENYVAFSEDGRFMTVYHDAEGERGFGPLLFMGRERVPPRP